MQKKGRESSDPRPNSMHMMPASTLGKDVWPDSVRSHQVPPLDRLEERLHCRGLFRPRRTILVHPKPENSVLSVEITENRETRVLDGRFRKRQENCVVFGRTGGNIRFSES